MLDESERLDNAAALRKLMDDAGGRVFGLIVGGIVAGIFQWMVGAFDAGITAGHRLAVVTASVVVGGAAGLIVQFVYLASRIRPDRITGVKKGWRKRVGTEHTD